jgi:hypothetical protein
VPADDGLEALRVGEFPGPFLEVDFDARAPGEASGPSRRV